MAKLKAGVYVNDGYLKKKILEVYKSYDGWIWFVTKKSKLIYFGFVHGLFDEWGSFYSFDVMKPDIYKVPESEWHNLPYTEVVK